MHSLSLTPPSPWSAGNFFNLFPRKEEPGKIKLLENKATYYIEATLPGFIKDDFLIHYKDGTLRICASSSRCTGPSTGATHVTPTRQFSESIALAEPVDEKSMTYLYEQEVLKIWVPKKSIPTVKSRLSLLERFLKTF